MAPDSKIKPKVAEEWSAMMDEDFEDRKLSMPSMEELQKEAEEIETALKSNEEDELTALMSGAERRKSIVPVPACKVPDESNMKTPTQPRRESLSSSPNYQESFTSQQETAEIRGELDSLDKRLLNIHAILETVIAEREGLVRHIDRCREDVNKQMTIVTERLNTALERVVSPSIVSQTKGEIETLTADTDKVFSQFKADLTEAPSSMSVTSRKEPITTSKRRVRIVE